MGIDGREWEFFAADLFITCFCLQSWPSGGLGNAPKYEQVKPTK